MLTITAIIRVKKGHETAMIEALLEVVKGVRANEATTVGYYISQDATDPCVFTTYERYPGSCGDGSTQQLRGCRPLLRHSQAFD